MNTKEIVTKRYVIDLLKQVINETPVLLLEGPRSVGKSTALLEVKNEIDGILFDLDLNETLDALVVDSSIILGNKNTVCIDEYQKLPFLLDDIKSQLNKGSEYGQFLLAGSTNINALPIQAQSLTGRLSKLEILPLSQAELHRTKPEFINSMFTDHRTFISKLKKQRSHLSKIDYMEIVVQGGLPLALKTNSENSRSRWFRDYLKLVFERDSIVVSNIKNPRMLREIFNQLSANTASILNINKIAEINEINHHTASDYLSILENLFLIRRLPAWGKTATTRAIKMPKIHILDSGVAAHNSNLTMSKLKSNNPTYLAEFGHLLESFIVGEICKEIAWQDDEYVIGHWRTKDKKEVDIIIENADGDIIAIEVKSSPQIKENDFEGLTTLKERVGEKLLAGIVLYLGQYTLENENGFYAIPVDELWAD